MSESATFKSGMDKSVTGLKSLIQSHLKFTLARDTTTASKRDWWIATSKAVQSIIIERMIATQAVHHKANTKRLYYFSLEFLMGRLFSNALYSAGVFEEMEHALQALGLETEVLRKEEYDMALGNGGLGRLAACFLDSLATLDLPAIGYGIHYQYGLFKQEFRNGHQVELPDDEEYWPIWLNTLRVPPDHLSANSAPAIERGTLSRITNGSTKLSNWAASTRKMKNSASTNTSDKESADLRNSRLEPFRSVA